MSQLINICTLFLVIVVRQVSRCFYVIIYNIVQPLDNVLNNIIEGYSLWINSYTNNYGIYMECYISMDRSKEGGGFSLRPEGNSSGIFQCYSGIYHTQEESIDIQYTKKHVCIYILYMHLYHTLFTHGFLVCFTMCDWRHINTTHAERQWHTSSWTAHSDSEWTKSGKKHFQKFHSIHYVSQITLWDILFFTVFLFF